MSTSLVFSVISTILLSLHHDLVVNSLLLLYLLHVEYNDFFSFIRVFLSKAILLDDIHKVYQGVRALISHLLLLEDQNDSQSLKNTPN